MSSDGPEYDDPRCPGCGKLFACTCPKLAAEYVPVYEAIKAAREPNGLTVATRKLAEIRAIAANNHIGGMSVPMSKRLMDIIDRPR